MSALNGLKLTAAQKPALMAPEQQRRAKLMRRLDEQICIAKAVQDGTIFSPKKVRNVYDEATGEKKQVEMSKRVKGWWFVANNGKLSLSVKYGSATLELAKGKYAVEVGSEKELVGVLDVIKAAVLAGELDTAIDNAANKLRAGFGK